MVKQICTGKALRTHERWSQRITIDLDDPGKVERDEGRLAYWALFRSRFGSERVARGVRERG